MPNGYTSDIYDNKDSRFNSFLLKCARAFLIDQRDDPLDARPRHIQSSPFYAEQEAEAFAEYERYDAMTATEAGREQRVKKVEADKRRAEDATKRAALAARYIDLINKVEDWEPASELAPLKAFMLEQLNQSLKWDCEGYSMPETRLLTDEAYLLERRERARKNLKYARERLEEHKGYVERNNKFVDAIYKEANVSLTSENVSGTLGASASD